MSWEDTDRWMHFDTTGRYITNEKGWRMARANVCAREGSLFYEVKIVRGIPPDGPSDAAVGPQPYVRMGWARREAPLDIYPGFDGYSYGITDKRFETMHRARPGKFFTSKPKKAKTKTAKFENVPIELNDHVRQGDIVGLEINLPSLPLHHKVVSGIYNPAVDLGHGFPEDDSHPPNPDPTADPHDIIRDRIPVPYKGNVYFETMDYVPTKALEAYADRTLNLSTLSTPAPGAPSIIKSAPNPNNPDPSLRTLPHSSIRVYKNGELIGTAFDNLLAFLPPASLPNKSAGAREGFDDGMLGYFPAVSCFFGAVAQVNFGEDGFWMPPPHLKHTFPVSRPVGGQEDVTMDTAAQHRDHKDARYYTGRQLRPMGERFKEQIAEDIVWDVIDEVDFFMQDGGYGGKVGAGAAGAKRSSANASLKEEIE